MNASRRQLLQAIGAVLGCAPLRVLPGRNAAITDSQGNFRFVYTNPAYRKNFKNFLENVFRLYPEDQLHELIAAAAMRNTSDRGAYLELQARLHDIKPFLGDLKYSVPTLAKQKRVLADQTLELLRGRPRIDGYLEVGSNGRFLDALEERFEIHGEIFMMSEKAPTHSLIDIVDRGQLFNPGAFVSLNDYRPNLAAVVPTAGVDLVTVYIGFHHCPIALRESFIDSIRTVLRPGGALVVRDHHAHDTKMRRMVALAHDVFNMGTNASWDYNARERRHFYPLETLDSMLRAAGFKSDGRRLYQPGDPTLNALMLYEKI